MLLLALLPAFASEIRVSASRPVVVAIDGQPTGVAGSVIDTRDVEPGDHLVEVRSFMGATLAEVRVRVGDGERLNLTWDRDNRTLYELTRVPLTSSLTSTPGEATRVAALPPASGGRSTGSLSVTGLSDISGQASVQGVELAFHSDLQGWLATDLRPPLVELHLVDNGRLRFHGAVEIAPGHHRTCHLHYRETAWTVTCETTGPARS